MITRNIFLIKEQFDELINKEFEHAVKENFAQYAKILPTEEQIIASWQIVQQKVEQLTRGK